MASLKAWGQVCAPPGVLSSTRAQDTAPEGAGTARCPLGHGDRFVTFISLNGERRPLGHRDGDVGDGGALGGRIWGPGRCPQGCGDELVALTAPVESGSSANSLGSTAVRDASCGDRRLSPVGGTPQGWRGHPKGWGGTQTPPPHPAAVAFPTSASSCGSDSPCPMAAAGLCPCRELPKKGGKRGQNNSGMGKRGQRPQMGRFRPD